MAQSQPHNPDLHLRCGSSPMSNGNLDSSGYAYPDTFDEDNFDEDTFDEDAFDYRSISHIEDWFDDAIFNLDEAMAQPDLLVDRPLESDDIGLQSPFSTPVVDQQPCAEADFPETLYNSTTQENVYGDTPYPQQSSEFPAFDNTTFDHLNGNSVPKVAIAQSPSGQTTSLTCCGHTFGRSKDLKRHMSTVHRKDDDPVYTCCCGKDDPRKDNHARHVGVCVKSPCPRPYVCKCSHPSQGRDNHLEHVKACSPGKRSHRRPNAS